MTARPKTITRQHIVEALIYDPYTGVFVNRKTGSVVGRVGWNGYVSVDVMRRPYRAHRIAWIYMTGNWPKHHIDHKDGNPENNKFDNLREANRFQNMANGKSPGNVNMLPRGVQLRKRSGTFIAQISRWGKTISLGKFDTAEDASEFYQLASEMIHGEYAYHLSRGAKKEHA